jgi:hypothetical protein
MAENFRCNISVVANCFVRTVDNVVILLALIGEVWFIGMERIIKLVIWMNCNQMCSGSL